MFYLMTAVNIFALLFSQSRAAVRPRRNIWSPFIHMFNATEKRMAMVRLVDFNLHRVILWYSNPECPDF